MNNKDIYESIDDKLKVYEELGRIFHMLTEYSLNRNFLLNKEEYKDLLESFEGKLYMIKPEDDFITADLSKKEYLLIFELEEDKYYVEMSIPLYLNYLYYLSDTFFKDSEEIKEYANLLKNKVNLEEGAFITLIHSLKESDVKELCVGVLNFADLDNRTFMVNEKTYPLVSFSLIPVLYSIVTPDIHLKDSKGKYRPVTVEEVTQPNNFIKNYLKLEPENKVGYIELKVVD